METIIFKWAIFLFAAILAIFSSLMMVTRRNPIHSALWLVVTMLSIALIYFSFHVTFIAIAQVVVYAGAIMMLFVFVIMLIHLEKAIHSRHKLTLTKIIATVITCLLLVEILIGILAYRGLETRVSEPITMAGVDNIRAMGTLLYGKYLFPFEVASILLLVGIIGAVVIAKRRQG